MNFWLIMDTFWFKLFIVLLEIFCISIWMHVAYIYKASSERWQEKWTEAMNENFDLKRICNCRFMKKDNK